MFKRPKVGRANTAFLTSIRLAVIVLVTVVGGVVLLVVVGPKPAVPSVLDLLPKLGRTTLVLVKVDMVEDEMTTSVEVMVNHGEMGSARSPAGAGLSGWKVAREEAEIVAMRRLYSQANKREAGATGMWVLGWQGLMADQVLVAFLKAEDEGFENAGEVKRMKQALGRWRGFRRLKVARRLTGKEFAIRSRTRERSRLLLGKKVGDDDWVVLSVGRKKEWMNLRRTAVRLEVDF